MIFHLQSTDPNNYGVIKFSANPPLGKEPLLFRINQINTVSSFLVTTKEDYIEIFIDDERKKFYFADKGDYERDTIDLQIQKYLDNRITCYFNELGTLTFKSNQVFAITDASHRVRLLTGMYNSKLPLKPVIDTGNIWHITIDSVPYNCLGNCLYLQSNVSAVTGFNDSENRDVYRSVCYHVNEMFIPGVPIISRSPGPKIKILPGDLTKLQFTLVDFQNEPVILKAPLRIVMEVLYDQDVVENVIVPDVPENMLQNIIEKINQ